MVCVPGVWNVAEKLPAPLASVSCGENDAFTSVLVRESVGE
jgi:hypothetical protein